MSNYFDSNDKKDCNGCGVCALKCPKNAIEMQEDSEGFLYPIIDKDKCVNCGLCKRVCSNCPTTNSFHIKVFAAKNKNVQERQNSTSGGIFKILVKNIISKNGVVFGVKYDEHLEVMHDYSETIEQCKSFSFSKYVRSNLRKSYEQAETFLKEERYVLFTGTPCQCYGLKKYLKKDYEKLLLCEIVCHSNPSPKVFKLYKRNLEKQNNKKIINYYFRSKNSNINNAPYAEFQDGSILPIRIYNSAFNAMLFSRPSCECCKFCDSNRKSDITIGDFWGIEHYFPNFTDEKGISLVCVNSLKGMELFDEIKKDIDYKETNLIDAFKYNHNSNIPPHKNRKKFFDGIDNGEINENNIVYYMCKYTKKTLIKRIFNKIRNVLRRFKNK